MKFDSQFSNFKEFLFLLNLITQSLSYPLSGWMSYLDYHKVSVSTSIVPWNDSYSADHAVYVSDIKYIDTTDDRNNF